MAHLKVVPFTGSTTKPLDIATCLRNILNQIDAGEFDPTSATLVTFGDKPGSATVFLLGSTCTMEQGIVDLEIGKMRLLEATAQYNLSKD